MDIQNSEPGKCTFAAISVLRWHYGMIGQPKSDERPPVLPFEQAFGSALGTTDPANFECLCPVLIFNRWDPAQLIAQTPLNLRGRLRLAAGIGLFFTDFSRLGMPFPFETIAALIKLHERTEQYSMDDDPWNDLLLKDEPEGVCLEFFRPYGLYANWPLVDFWKQYQWAAIRNQERIKQFIEAVQVSQGV
jgi:hypothetical protein